MSTPLPTMADVAREAGVGVATVDRVLNKRAPVRPTTEKKVLEAARKLGFALSKMKALDEIYAEPAKGVHRRLSFILLNSQAPLYQALAEALRSAAADSPWVTEPPEILFLDNENPQEVAALLLKAGERADAVALASLDHPAVNQAIDTLHAQGKHVFSLITDLTATHRAGYVGIDNRKAGRTAAWALSRLCRKPGEIGMLIGDHRFLCQELSEISFKSYFRERAPQFQLLETLLTHESSEHAFELTRQLLQAHPDLTGLFISGGGTEGTLEAIRASGRAHELTTVCLDLTEETRAALIDETLTLVLAHPQQLLARTLVEAMTQPIEDNGAAWVHLLPFEMITAENL